jgi:Flp pilus assembly protein TadG
MRYQSRKSIRKGAVLPLVAICMIALMGMLALAIDIGMVAVARTQAQNAADSAAMAGARTITGNTGQNYNQVAVNAITAATDNSIFNANVAGDPSNIANPSSDMFTSGQVTVMCGGYSYVYNDSSPAKEGFQLTMPGKPTGEPYSAVQVTVNGSSPTSFGRVLGLNSFNVSATSAAAHRPRDVAIIMDLSGSMRFESLPGVYVDSSGTAWPNYPQYARNVSMNPDPSFPQWGHYSATSSAALQGSNNYPTSTGVTVDLSNISYGSNAGPAIIPDFMTSGSTPAFTAASSSVTNATPGGDDSPKYSGSYVPTVNAFLNNTSNQATMLTFSRNATAPSATGFAGNGYTQGPSYWGKTFFMFPPDPRGSDLDANNTANHANNGALDWRQRFFFKKASNGNLYWLDHNNILFNPAGTPMTGSNAVTPIIKTPQTSTTVTENGSSVTYTYAINYLAILTWLQANPAVFPASMTSGRIQYYASFPDTTDTALNSRWWTTYPLTNLNERFWKDYIDFVLGLRGTAAGTYSATNPQASNVPLSALIGNGDYFKWGNTAIQISQKPDCYATGTVNASGAAAGATVIAATNINKVSGGTSFAPATGDYVSFNTGSTIYQITLVATAGGVTTLTLDQGLKVAVASGATARFWSAAAGFPYYMNFNDNIYRPRHQFWFGPMTFVDWLGNYQTNQFLWPGNVHEAQAWACKVGIQTAITDMQNNHPNDYVGISFFSTPMYTTGDGGHFNFAVVPLGQNYQQLINALWFPPTTVTGTATSITPYDNDMQNVPRANGGTCPGMSFMVAYNMLSSSVSNLRTYATPEPQYRGSAGGLGRKGADRLVIFETDGAPNTRAVATIANKGSDSYYPIRVVDPANLNDTNNEYPTGGTYANNEVYDVVKQITALNTASPPGYSTSRKQALVFSIGYGSLFDPANAGSSQTTALNFLQSIQFYGNTSKDTTGTNFPTWQRIYGTPSNRTSGMQTAFTKIMQAGVQVSIIQ